MGRAVLIATLLGVLAAGAAAQAQTSVERGEALVQRNCGMCHAVGTKGDSPFKPAPPFRELGRRYPLDNLDEALAEGILTGHPAMPQFRFSPGEINDLIAYLKSIQVRTEASAARRTGRAR